VNGTQAQRLRKLITQLCLAEREHAEDQASRPGQPPDLALYAQLQLAQAKVEHYINHLTTTRV